MGNDNQSARYSGASFLSLLTLVFITLKLTGVIYWSWWLVLSPLWVPWLTILTIIIIGTLFTLSRKNY